MVSAGLCLIALICAGASGFVLSQGIIGVGARAYRHSLAMDASGADGRRLFIQGGCRPLLPACEALLDRLSIRDRCAELAALAKEKAGLAMSAEVVLSWLLATAVAVLAAATLVSSSLVCGLACSSCLVLGCFAAARTAADRRAERLREAVPSALRSMGVCFRAGFSLQQTLKQVSAEVGDPLGDAFANAAYVLETGGSASEALDVLKERSQSSELAFVCAALNIQHLSGGSLSPVLEAAHLSVQDDIDLKRSLRVQTSQARLSARIVTLMPFLLIAVFSLVSEGFLEPFFTSVAGVILLVLALAMQLAGVLLVRRMLDVKVG